jgi:uncharacterized membrane protein
MLQRDHPKMAAALLPHQSLQPRPLVVLLAALPLLLQRRMIASSTI